MRPLLVVCLLALAGFRCPIATALSFEEYSAWCYGNRVYSATLDGDLLLATLNYAQTDYVYSYRLRADGSADYLDGQWILGGEPRLIAGAGGSAWIVDDNYSNSRLLSLDAHDPENLAWLAPVALQHSDPRDLLVLPGWVVVTYYNQYALCPILANGAAGSPVYHNDGFSARIRVSGDQLLMPTPTGGAARRVLQDGALETVCTFPADLDIALAAWDGAHYIFYAGAAGHEGLYIYDSDCAQQLAQLDLQMAPHSLLAQDGDIVLGEANGLAFFHYTGSGLEARGRTRATRRLLQARQLHQGRLACLWDDYVSYGEMDLFTIADLRGFRWIDTGQPAELACSVNTELTTLASGQLALGDETGLLRILEPRADGHLQQSAQLSFAGQALPIWSEGGLLAVSHGLYAGFSLVDVSDPHAPQVLGQHSTPDMPVDAERVGDLLYVADDGAAGYISGVRIFDISDPLQPQYVGRVESTLAAKRVACRGAYLAVAGEVSNSGRLQLFSLGDPAHPALEASWSHGFGLIDDLAFVGNHLVAVNFETLAVLSLPDLELVDQTWSGYFPTRMAADSSGIYLFSGDDEDRGTAFRYEVDEAGQLHLTGSLDRLGLLQAQQLGEHLWSLCLVDNGCQLLALPAHRLTVTPRLALRYANGQLLFTLAGAPGPGSYILRRQDDEGLWREVLRQPATGTEPIEVTLPLSQFPPRGFFQLTIDLP